MATAPRRIAQQVLVGRTGLEPVVSVLPVHSHRAIPRTYRMTRRAFRAPCGPQQGEPHAAPAAVPRQAGRLSNIVAEFILEQQEELSAICRRGRPRRGRDPERIEDPGVIAAPNAIYPEAVPVGKAPSIFDAA